MTTIVKFELAKLLKEKGFELENQWSEDYKHNFYAIKDFDNDWRDSFSKRQKGELLEGYYLSPLSENVKDVVIIAPTIAEVVMWLYEKHRIQLFLDYTYYDGFHYGIKWVKANGDYGQIWRDNNGEMADGFDSWKEAYEASIEHCLTNLI